MVTEAGINVRYGMKCTSIDESPEKAQAIFTFLFSHTETADLCVGADGIQSHVRGYISPSTIPKFSGQMGLGGPVATSKLRNVRWQMPLPALIMGQNNSFALMPCSYTGNQVGVFATIGADDHGKNERSSERTSSIWRRSSMTAIWKHQNGPR